MTASDYQPLLEKIRTQISCWTVRALSFAGRIQLISSVIFSLTNFWIAAFRLPKACICEIDKICSAFLWSGPSLNPKKTKVAWSEVCTPKREGGLGLRSIEEANKVSVLKLIWRILSAKGSLWVEWVEKYLIRKGSFWAVKENTSCGSWMWKKILKYREKAKQFHRVEVRNGENTSFWFDRWSPLGCLHEQLGDRGCVDLGIPRTTTVGTVLVTHRSKTHRQIFLNLVEEEIRKQRVIRKETKADVALWKGRNDCYRKVFNSKETWSQIRVAKPLMDGYKRIWFSYATPKYSVLTWLVIKNRVATGERIAQWNTQASTSCIFCQHVMETRDHLFFKCPYSLKVWKDLMQGFLLTKFSANWREIFKMLTHKDLDKTKTFILRYVFQNTIHSIWRERNNRRHGEEPSPSEKLTKIIDKNIRNRLSTIRREGELKYAGGMQAWFASKTQ